ncbi:CoA transferase, partial [Streptomyces katrae]
PELAEDPSYATNAARTRGRESTDAVVAGALGKLSADEAVERLEAAGIACARLNSVAQLAGHPQLAARDRWRE